MKKGIVVILVVLALVVIVAPGIVGMLAEKSVDEQIEWTETDNRDLKVTAVKFDRGWFSSQGQHRIELLDTANAAGMKDLLGLRGDDSLPALIIDTKLNHGPLAFGGESGSLQPGLGNAVSTLSFETTDGEIIALPGEIYSSLSLVGDLRSSYQANAGSSDNATWSDIQVDVESILATGAYSYDGTIAALHFAKDEDDISLENFAFSGDLEMSEFNFVVGDMRIAIDDMSVATAGQPPFGIGPVLFETHSEIAGERVNSRSNFAMEAANFPAIGPAGIDMQVAVDGIDALALKRLINRVQVLQSSTDPMDMVGSVNQELLELLLAGADIRIERLDIALPQGTIRSHFNVNVKESDSDQPEWASLLLATAADAKLEIPEMIANMAMIMAPNAEAIEQFLIKNGDVYEVEAAYKQGLLTVNGLPMPLPIR